MSRYGWLLDDEEVIHDGRAHASVLVGPALRSLALIAALALLGFAYDPQTSTDVVDYAAGVVAAIVIARYALRVPSWWTTRRRAGASGPPNSNGALMRRGDTDVMPPST